MDSPCTEAGEKVEGQETQRTHAILHIISKQIEEPHIADGMHPASMEEHGGQERQEILEGEAAQGEDFGMEIAGRHDAKMKEKGFDFRRRKRELVGKDQSVHQDDRPGHEGWMAMGDIVADGYQG